MAFRSTQNCERYEYVSVNLETPITLPANNNNQDKTGYKFTHDGTNDGGSPVDWYNAYFSINLKITEMDNTGYGAGDNAAIINGGFSIIDSMKVYFDSAKVIDSDNVNHALNVKNLTDFSSSYTNEVGPSMFHYPDTAVGAVSQKYTTLDLTGNAQTIAPTDQNTYNEGFAKRKTLLSAAAENNIILPLNRFGFFQSFQDQIAPNGKVTFVIKLTSDDNVIFRDNAAGAGRYVITKFVLRAPKIQLTPNGQKLFAERYLKPYTWTYLKENIMSAPFTQKNSTFTITPSIRKPRHVFIWVLNPAKFEDQEQNMFLFNTFNIANARTITSARLQVGSGVFYPDEVMDPTNNTTEIYRELLQYNKSFNDYLSGPTIDLKSFKDLYGILYFDLTKQKISLKEGNPKLELKFKLNDTPNAAFNMYALVLNEEELTVDVKSGKAVLRT